MNPAEADRFEAALYEIRCLLSAAANDGKPAAVKESNANLAWHAANGALVTATEQDVRRTMMWCCGWSEKGRRCVRLDCHNSGPCGGFTDTRRGGEEPRLDTECERCGAPFPERQRLDPGREFLCDNCSQEPPDPPGWEGGFAENH